jgi:hypothetical protein
VKTALVYALVAVALGMAVALGRRDIGWVAHPAWILIPSLASALIVVSVSRFIGFPRVLQVPPQRQFALGVGMVLASLAVVVATEFSMSFQLPSRGALVVGLALGLAGVGAWIERDASVSGAKIAVLLLYLASGTVAISTLFTNLPPAAFWVVSAIVPAWQARRLVSKGDLTSAFRLLNASTRVFLAVLAVALWLPALLLFR